jgi:thiosulfate/3-mercaptopyruvate sulfurtransferase
MDYINQEALVGPDWLKAHLGAPDVRIVDATYFVGSSERNAKEEFGYRHIPGAVFFDINEITDSGSPLPHMLPSPEKFSSKVRDLGLGDGCHVVVYDSLGGFCAAMRAWWMFRVFGHHDVSVLDGGLPKWGKEGGPLEEGPANPRPRHFSARLDNTLVRNADDILANIKSRREQIIDARSAKRFQGAKPEPRPCKRRGHIPGSINVPFADLMIPAKGWVMRPADEIVTAFEAAGVDLEKPIAASCGSGVTACAVVFGLYLIGKENVAVYDGSWAEWGDREDLPIATGT